MELFLQLFENVITPGDVLQCPCVGDADPLYDAHTVLVTYLMRLAGNLCQNLAHAPGFQRNAKPKSFTPLSVPPLLKQMCKDTIPSISFFFFHPLTLSRGYRGTFCTQEDSATFKSLWMIPRTNNLSPATLRSSIPVFALL